MAYTQSISQDSRKSIVLVLLLVLTAAPLRAQQWHTSVEITYPAEISLPLHISELLLVNNAVAHPDHPTGAFYTLMAASEMLEGSDYLPSVLETSQNTSGSLYRKQLLTAGQADSLLTIYSSDALIVLNQLIAHPVNECFETDNGMFYAYTQVVAASHWTLYFRNDSSRRANNLSARTLMYTDTLYWETEADTYAEAMQALPEADEACNEMFIYIGEHLAERFMPQTETADRYLYDLGDNDEGMRCFARKQWQQAVEAWSQPRKDRKQAAYAAANSAVAYELLGDLPAAYAATGRALNAFESLRSADARQQAVNIRYYQEQLRIRMSR